MYSCDGKAELSASITPVCIIIYPSEIILYADLVLKKHLLLSMLKTVVETVMHFFQDFSAFFL